MSLKDNVIFISGGSRGIGLAMAKKAAADGAKIVEPRLLHGTQWGIICPIHTPDGGNIGFHKHLAISTMITSGCSGNGYIS